MRRRRVAARLAKEHHTGSRRWLVLGLLAMSLVAVSSTLPAAPQPVDAVAGQSDPAADSELSGFRKIEAEVNDAFGTFNGWIATVLFYPIPLSSGEDTDGDGQLGPGEDTNGNGQLDPGTGLPAAVLWLVAGSLFFTIRMGFINFRGFFHAIKVTAGKYDNDEDEGEVSHFQALTAALSATVGLGNIAGVAVAVSVGGPGATFWMVLAGLLGMSAKFVECTLGQKYREVREDGRVMGGAMYYLSRGLAEKKLGALGTILAFSFAILCIGGSFAGGNAFQVSQSLRAVEETIPVLKDAPWLYGLAMTAMVGVVIIGGIKRIAATAATIVPFMCGVYVLAAIAILVMNASQVPAAFSAIFSGAFSADAAYGGFLGVLIMGFKRAAFSNEAGIGSAAIAHSAAKTEFPVREGIVALLEPFIDTVVVCTMTALVIIVTGAYSADTYRGTLAEQAAAEGGDVEVLVAEHGEIIEKEQGAQLTSRAMGAAIPYFEYVLSAAVILFAYSTMISWSYYGERCWAYLFGDGASMSYRIIFLVFVFLGSVVSAKNVLELGDLMIMGMAVPNILGVLLLSGGVKRDLDEYWRRLKAGDFDGDNASSGGVAPPLDE
ncbi:MAG: alanine:cation symporter family protein [Planctomycetales bacterium]|nr:alanine:cation symporter family protein [Planctomycetales bacterium]